MTLETRLDFMDYRVVAILQVMVETDEILCPEDVVRILARDHGVHISIVTVARILVQLSSMDFLVRYYPVGIPSNADTVFYLGPRLRDIER